MRYLIINAGIVTNAVEWDGKTDYKPDGELIRSDTGDIGDSYHDGIFIRPPEPDQAA